ncbi:helix-turn-helix domain-containing protein [uncultured Holdemanella sp.]|uniref:helix-turn-helix domain-containing protein n=1 Tax=uncultured Holdemanella sp. TaxID=1763549 RepID=UPI00265AC9D4|nr:helix-turn-helix transcriptional regulator [uncultured Holdemanella sp.]
MGIDRNNYHIGLYLDKVLNDKNLTIKELSDLSGIEITMLRKFLINEKSPSLTTINKISNALNMDPEYFTSDSYSKDGNIKATILSNDLILHIDKNNEKDLKKAFRAMNRMMNQIFNSLSLKGKRKIAHILHLILVTYIREIAYSDNKSKDSWKHLYSDSSLLHDMFGISEKDYIKFRTSFNNQLNTNTKKHNSEQH